MNSPRSFVLLLVDDDPMVLEALQEMFCDDFETLTARSGEEAIRLLQKHTETSAVILDIKMSGMSGIATLSRLQELRPDIPIIIHTANPQDLQSTFKEMASKPYDLIKKGDSCMQLDRVVRSACLRMAQKSV